MDVGQRSSLPSRPPASFKGTTARASTVYEKKQNHNIAGLKPKKKKKKAEVNLGHTQSISNIKVCCVLYWNLHHISSYLFVVFLSKTHLSLCFYGLMFEPRCVE